jgi:hypothetical protein
MKAPIFFVTASEYPKLQQLCPKDFPFSYEQFVERVELGISSMSPEHTPVKIEADVAEFISWCTESKVQPDNNARGQYAMWVYGQGLDPTINA